jgi:hypothetical protein
MLGHIRALCSAVIPEYQVVFEPNRLTVDQIFKARQIMDKYLKRDRNIYKLFDFIFDFDFKISNRPLTLFGEKTYVMFFITLEFQLI